VSYRSKYFRLHELVDRTTYENYGEKTWEFFDPSLLKVLDRIKEKFNKGTMTINNWYWRGDRQYSGLRTPESPYYSYTSMHSWGKAFDAVFSAYSAEHVRQYILDNIVDFQEIKGIEIDISWLHIDTRNREDLITFKP